MISALDRQLAEWAAWLDRDGWAGCLLDPEQRLVWMSREMKKFLGESDEERLGFGHHIAEVLLGEVWSRTITPDSQLRLVRDLAPYLADESLVSEVDVSDDVANALHDVLASAPRQPQPPVLAGTFQYADLEASSYEVRFIAVALRDSSGQSLGTVVLTDMAAPATLISLLARGDHAMHQRMAELTVPGQRSAAILFADLPGSGELARRLPTSVYFRLIQALTATFDELVGEHAGVVGRHAGDGMTAFFLAPDGADAPRAATAALHTTRLLQSQAEDVFADIIDDGLLPECTPRFDVGLHWGWSLYMGQLVPHSRLEVTALGDEVNECARIQEVAAEGSVLASKQFVELVDASALNAVGIDPERLSYQALASIPGASDKAVRDAGNLALATLPL